jgi:hypothetical protein
MNGIPSKMQQSNPHMIIPRCPCDTFPLSPYEEWATEKGSSIYIQWIPDEMTESDAKHFFSTYGIVERVEIVYKMKNGMKIGRMLFVHFLEWHETFLPGAIAQSHPDPVELEYGVTKRSNSVKIYKLKCRINLRKTEHSPSQLSDMFENLEKKFVELHSESSAAIARLERENKQIRDEYNALVKRVQLCEQIGLCDISRFEDIYTRLDHLEMGDIE